MPHGLGPREITFQEHFLDTYVFDTIQFGIRLVSTSLDTFGYDLVRVWTRLSFVGSYLGIRARCVLDTFSYGLGYAFCCFGYVWTRSVCSCCCRRRCCCKAHYKYQRDCRHLGYEYPKSVQIPNVLDMRPLFVRGVMTKLMFCYTGIQFWGI